MVALDFKIGGRLYLLYFVDGDFDVPLQAVVGAELKTLHFDHIKFISEVGFDVSEAFTYFSIGVVLEIDGDLGVRFD